MTMLRKTAKFYASQMMPDNPDFYHTIHHVDDMLNGLEKFNLAEEDRTMLYVVICFHDIVYIPGNTDNEERSIEVMREALKNWNGFDLDKACRLLLSTKIDFSHVFADDLEKILHTLDWNGFADFEKMKANHVKIFNEALAKEFKPATITKAQIGFYQNLKEHLLSGYKIDFFNESNNQKAIENLTAYENLSLLL